MSTNDASLPANDFSKFRLPQEIFDAIIGKKFDDVVNFVKLINLLSGIFLSDARSWLARALSRKQTS